MTSDPDYGAVLADLKDRRAKLDAAIEAIEAIASSGVGSGGGSARAGTSTAIKADSFFGFGALDGAIKYLGMVKKVQSPSEIAEALEAGGMTHASQNLANTLSTTLSRSASHNGPVVKVGKNWGLAEWYPGLKNKRLQPADKDTLSRLSGGASVVEYDEDEEGELTGAEAIAQAVAANAQQQPS